MRRADRLIKIVHFMRSRRRAVTAAQIGEEFEICVRTVYRDIQDLMNSGVPILGEAGVGYMIDKEYYLPPVTFSVDELEAISLGISVVRQWTDDRFAACADSAMEKIHAVLPANRQGELQQITTYSRPSSERKPWIIEFSDLRESIRIRRKITVDYADEQGRKTTRTLRPLALIFFGPDWLLAAWCETRKDFRTFRLDRIQKLENSDQVFADEEDKNLDAYRAKFAAE